MEEVTVDCLINPDTRTLNTEMVDGIFIPQEAKAIKKISLSRFAVEDSIFWPLSHDGQYSCKAGYWFLKEGDDFNIHEEPPDYEQGLWNKIWSLNSSNKVKHLIWRMCKNSLPTKGNLVRRQIVNDSSSDRCSKATKNCLHVVWSCPGLADVWEASEIWNSQSEVTF